MKIQLIHLNYGTAINYERKAKNITNVDSYCIRYFSTIEIAVGVSLWVSPESVIDTVDNSEKGVDFLFYMWAVRQVALGVIFGFATFKKSNSMLTISYIFLLVMFVGDLSVGILQNEVPLIISAGVMSLIAFLMLIAVNKRE